ncbi:hypothetical protein IGI04_035873 [Brassica rapa subsp. trilocularis]|uniref:DUF223 domain-containing protein n=1 Tax=Brassica rapa subsp. trilocularis TaxID=1813537 RepID=A0ABQ7LFZ3_BRACM|nr:hypothetical protein IGI04_035873 [Brassica rapa subsp. trilocularis]
MASSDAVLAHSAFDALRLRRSAQFIVGRLLRFWDSKNIKKQGEFMGITLLLLDEKNSVIHVLIPAARSPYYRPLPKAVSVVRVCRFEVASGPPFAIWFIPQTIIDEDAPMINVEKFMLRKFDPLQALANTNLELPGLSSVNVCYLSIYVIICCSCKFAFLKLTNHDAAALLLDEVNGGDVTKLPQCFAELAGEEFVFHIHVTPCNFTANHCTFTLYEISSNLNLETFSTNEAPFVEEEGGQTSASASIKVRSKANEPYPFGKAKMVA